MLCAGIVIELSTPEGMKRLNKSVQRHAATKRNQMGTTFLETPMHKVLPVTDIIGVSDIVKKRIEYTSDDDDVDGINEDHDDDDDDDGGGDHGDGDITLSANSLKLPLPSSPTTPRNYDNMKSHDPSSASLKGPQDVLADKIASYVAASSDGSSPDSKVIIQPLINDLLFLY